MAGGLTDQVPPSAQRVREQRHGVTAHPAMGTQARECQGMGLLDLPTLKDPSVSLLPPLTETRRVATEIAFAVGIEAQKDGVAPKVSGDELRSLPPMISDENVEYLARQATDSLVSRKMR